VAALLPSLVPIAQSGPDPTPYLAGVVIGLVVGVAGHIYKSNLFIAAGIVIIGVSTGLFAFQGPST